MMLPFSTLVTLSALLLNLAQAAPVQIERRINQTISDSTKAWQQACVKAGGTIDKCSNVAVAAFSSLQEAAGVCAQQDGADAMIDLAKQFNSNPDMIKLAQIFVQQPRNSPEKKQIPYCQVAPKNPELNGLFHCQFAGSDFTVFEGDQSGNVPLGLTSLSTSGSCPAKPDGPVPDGVQLNTLVTEPIAPSNNSEASTRTNSTVDSVDTGLSSVSNSTPAAASAGVPIANSCSGPVV